VILAKTVKGYGMGAVGEGKNIAHQQKKMPLEALKQFRDRFNIPIPDDKLAEIPYYKPAEDSQEMKYLRALREARGGSIPQRRRKSTKLVVPKLETFKALLEATGEGREISTTMAFVRMLTALVKDKAIGKNVVPIVPDESRTFGMEGLFRQLGIYSSVGQLYEPEDSDQLMFYKEDKNGQILQEGINEPGAQCSWIAAATSYSNNNVPMIPFYIFYSMFGLQRVGDLVWASGDIRARGFLMGGTAGRTTLNGEGLQHEDGHSHILSSVIPNCISYDPTFSYEVAVVVQDGLRRMVEEQQDVFYYITLMNENYPHPAMPEGAREGILKGMYKLADGGGNKESPRVQLLGSGVILREVLAAAELLKTDWGIVADVWSCPSFTELRRDGIATSRWNLLHPADKPRLSYVEQCLAATKGPVIASTDYMRTFADQIREFVPRRYKVLGTDGFGRSDSRENLRRFFEVNRFYVAVAALKALAEDGEVPAAKVAEAIKKYGIDADKPAPWTV
jgi:pyruvate dehydrogenase E1 component